MSTYTSSSTQLRPSCLAVVREMMPKMDAVAGAIAADWTPEKLRQLGDSMSLSTPTSIRRAANALSAALPGWEGIGPLQDLVGAESRSIPGHSRVAEGRIDVAKARADIVAAANDAASTMKRVQRLAVAAAAAQTLTAMGFTVTRADEANATGLEARRGHQIFAAAIHDGGTMDTDQAGLVGDTCDRVQQQVQAGMTDRGVDMSPAVFTDHRDPRGGALIVEAGKRRRSTLAAGIAAVAQSRSPLAGTGGPVQGTPRRVAQ